MAIKTLKCNNIIIEFPTIKFKRTKNDQHKEEQNEPVHGTGQTGSGGEIEALVRKARIRYKDGGQ
jgi:hypothetical protein